jgi:hypothetical protein
MTLSGKPHSGELISVIALVIPQWNSAVPRLLEVRREGKTPHAVGTDFRLEPENIPSQNLNFGASSPSGRLWHFTTRLRSHRDSGVTMKSTHDLLGRLRNIMPAGIQPKFTSSQELMAWQQEEGRKRAVELEKLNQGASGEDIWAFRDLRSA